MKRNISIGLVVVVTLIGRASVGQESRVENPHGSLPQSMACTDCHSTGAWTPTRTDLDFNHDDQTSFELLGRHAQATCASCHADLRFDKPKVGNDECATCHVDVHLGNFVDTCAQCHNQVSFNDVDGTAIHETTGFPLTGSHVQIACESCHVDDNAGAFAAVDADCASCHESDYETARTIDHAALGYPMQCEQCHSTFAWNAQPFDHLVASGGFELAGAHEPLACERCHQGPAFDLPFTPSDQNDCVACHQTDYDAQHAGSGFPTTCQNCHGIDTWEGADFDHAIAANGFDLVGAHAPLTCESCHQLPGLELLFMPDNQNDCVACHQPDYDSEHAGSGFPTTCQNCHGIDTWEGADFDHAIAANGFDLVGVHAPLACESCHQMPGLELLFTPSDQNDCISCHQMDYDDNHAGSGFPTTCQNCHGIDTWEDANFDHAIAANGFDLVGAHAPLACESCHQMPGLELLFTPSDQNDCISCHQLDYDDNHAGSGFPTTCQNCHGIDAWEGADFDHAVAANGFDLVGAHAPLACESCHQMPGLELLFTPSDQNDCISCHQLDYDDNHAGSGFPTTCQNCHGIDTWEGVDFDHAANANGFDLVGAHAPLACESCHQMPGLELLFTPSDQNDCIACHQSDYDSEHATSNYPTNCLTCHSTANWGSDFDHATYFPIYRGAHEPEQWGNDCTTCHTAAPVNFVPFSCFTCHEHNQSDTDRDHDEVTDYAYVSELCLSCHPSGEN